MMIREHVAEYIERGRRAAAALEQARAQTQQPSVGPRPAAAETQQARRAQGRNQRSIVINTGES
jgi:hypothetical protein